MPLIKHFSAQLRTQVTVRLSHNEIKRRLVSLFVRKCLPSIIQHNKHRISNSLFTEVMSTPLTKRDEKEEKNEFYRANLRSFSVLTFLFFSLHFSLSQQKEISFFVFCSFHF